MKTTKMSLANIQGKLSRTEMKNIMAGAATICWVTTCNPASLNSSGFGTCPGDPGGRCTCDEKKC